MKIGFVRRGYSPTGGAERFLRRFAEGLSCLGHEAVLFSDSGWPEQAWDASMGELVRLSASGNGMAPLAFADALEASKPRNHCDFLFSFERVWNCDAYRAGDGVHRAWLERRSHFEAPWRTWFRGWQAKHRQLLELEASLYSPDSEAKIVANSQMVKREIREWYGMAEDRIAVIPNGYDTGTEKPGAHRETRNTKRAELGLAENELAVLFAGSGWERKGLRFALQAVERLNKGRPARLIVAGTGRRPRGADSAGAVFLGAVDSLGPLYEAADAFVLPTLYDPFSNACLEAAAHGLPVVTTTANGFSDILDRPELGAAVPPGDVTALVSALEASSATLSREVRDLIRNHAAKYSVTRNVEATLEFILAT